jgi:hypothetical protein
MRPLRSDSNVSFSRRGSASANPRPPPFAHSGASEGWVTTRPVSNPLSCLRVIDAVIARRHGTRLGGCRVRSGVDDGRIVVGGDLNYC